MELNGHLFGNDEYSVLTKYGRYGEFMLKAKDFESKQRGLTMRG